MDITEILGKIAGAASIVPLSTAKPDVGVPITLGLTPFPPLLDIVQAGDLSAIWFTKDVRFANALGAPEGAKLSTYLTKAETILGGRASINPTLTHVLGPSDLLKIPVTTKATGGDPSTDLTAGTPGVLGQLTGTLPIALQVPISVTVKWSVTKKSFENGIENGQAAEENVDYYAPKGLEGPILELVFRLADEPQELTQTFKPIVQFEIVATVTVAALGVSAEKKTPAITLPVPAVLGIPTMAVLFRHPNYLASEADEGAAAIFVRDNALIRNVVDLAPFLDHIREVLTRVQSFKNDALQPNFATLLLGLNTLIGALDLQPRFQFYVGDLKDLGTLVFSKTPWRIFPPQWGGSTSADDMTSSVIIVGVKTGVQLFGDNSFKDNQTHKFHLDFFVGPGCWAEIRNLFLRDNENLEPNPSRADGTKLDFITNEGWPLTKLDNTISSIKFGKR